MIHFGLTSLGATVLYTGFVVACLLSLFWRPIVGIYFLVPIIPLQTARYYLIGLPLGKSVVDVTILCILLGLYFHSPRVFQKTPWNLLLGLYSAFTFVSLCLGSFYLGVDLPFSLEDPRLGDWKNYIVMPLLLILVAATVQNKKQMKILLLLMCAATLVLNRGFWDTVSGRDFSAFSYDLRDAGGMGYAGVNGFAAYEAQFVILLLALAFFLKNVWLKVACYALVFFSTICLLFSFSRGAYLATVLGCLFLGIVKERKLILVLAVLAFTWTTVLPEAVQERITMTYDQSSGQLDHSAELRVDLWDEALGIIKSNPITGSGFYTYAYSAHVHDYRDSHNYYLKVMAETGVVGMTFLLWILGLAFWRGFTLFRNAKDPFMASLGLGLAGWVVASAVANAFGDRWTFLQVNGYMWVLAGLVTRAAQLEEQKVVSTSQETSTVSKPELVPDLVGCEVPYRL
jgi:putative inorganic carbon (hco3(-)) transporter